MWTNIFRIGELQVVSWFQLLPYELDASSLSEKSLKAEQKDAATNLVLLSHLHLQKEGFLSTWTNSFVGPWDPSQGLHNPDEKVKLWLFLPGRHSLIVESAQAAISRLRVVGNGVWSAPGDSEEVSFALSQALRNSIERALKGLSYTRFGDVFTRCVPSVPSEKNFRKAQPTFEFVFAATEEAVYVHAVISAKFIRGLHSNDMERVLRHRSSGSIAQGLPVVVAPIGMQGQLTGCCPSDLVKQVYNRRHAISHGSSVDVPFHIAQSSGCQLRGQDCYAEVTLGCPCDKSAESNPEQNKDAAHCHASEAYMLSTGRGQHKQVLADQIPKLEKTFIYPAECVLIPITHRAFARSSPKRFLIQGSLGSPPFHLWPLWNFSASSNIERCFESLDGLWLELMGSQSCYNSRSNSFSSSISSRSSTSSGSDHVVVLRSGDLEADADSVTCRQSGLSTNDQFENDGPKKASKRPRTSLTDTFGQSGTVVNANIEDQYNEYSAVLNNPATEVITNAQVGWNLDDDDRGIGMDIHILLSEFGDFSDFFKEEVLNFGEPPGTAESQTLVFPSADGGDVSGSPSAVGMDIADQKLSPACLTSYDNFNHSSVVEDIQNASMEFTRDAASSIVGSHSLAASTGSFEYLTKAEATMTFAPEYAAVETPASEFSMSIFRTPYLPRSKRVESSLSSSTAYIYGALPPPGIAISEEKEVPTKVKSGTMIPEASAKSVDLYKRVHNRSERIYKRAFNHDLASCKGEAPSSVSGMNSLNSSLGLQSQNYITLDMGNLLLSLKSALASEIECMMFQAAMCRIRHTLLSLSNRVPSVFHKLTGNTISNLDPADATTTPDMICIKYEAKKKESIPLRIAGDVDGGMIDGPITAQVGVWRSVGAPKGAKSLNTRAVDSLSSLQHDTMNEDGSIDLVQLTCFQEFLDAMPILVQQSTSFVDVSLDTDDIDGSYNWLALQEQHRRGFSCGPSMVHAGCGGLLASCHYLDIAGVNLIDPLSAEVQVSAVTSLLQSDIKAALKSAFGNLDGPLSVIDWCRGRSHAGDSSSLSNLYSFPCMVGEVKDSTSTVTLVGEPLSPPQSSGGSFCTREGGRFEESFQRRPNHEMFNAESEQQKCNSHLKPTLSVLPLPAILVGYQDDWLKTSPSCLQLWEKGPLEPYALSKPVNYYALCPDIDFLTSAAADFFQQLGTVYETCKLGTHFPQVNGGQIGKSSGKCMASGLIPVDCPDRLKAASNNLTGISSTCDYFLALSKGWSVRDFVRETKQVLKNLKLASSSSANLKEGNIGPCTVVYVVCPFPGPTAVLQTLVECSAVMGSAILAPEKERRTMFYSQVMKALNCTAAADEASTSNVIMISGFNIPKFVLQIITVESVLGVDRSTTELSILKDIAFTVYNKARRIPRANSSVDYLQQSSVPGRSQSTLMHPTASIQGLWKDCLTPRISGSSLTRESEIDAALRSGTWDNSWQTSRTGSLSCDPNRTVDLFSTDDVRYNFEPLFILAEPGTMEHGVSPLLGSNMLETSNSKFLIDDSSGIHMQSSTSGGMADVGTGSLIDGPEHDQWTASLHCSYGWTEDWRWLVCIWTDSRGELLDSNIFPFGGISSLQDTKVLQSLFVQVLYHSCQILSSSSPDGGPVKQKDIIITRIGSFFELECQEWQKAIYSIGGNEVKKWPLQLRRSMPDPMPSNTNGSSLQQQDMSLIQERNLPSSPSPPFYSSHGKSSFMKGSLGQTNTKKQLLLGHTGVSSTRGLLHLVQSISLVGVSIDHSLHLIYPADTSSSGGGTQSSNSSSGVSGYIEGFSPVKSVGSMPASYLLIPSPNLRYLNTPFQLPTCLTSESPPLAHLLHSKGSAIPLATGYVVSKAVPHMRKDLAEPTREDWPSVLAVSLIDHYGSNISSIQGKMVRGMSGSSSGSSKQGRTTRGTEALNRDYETESHVILESVAAELHSLSWMTSSPVYSERRTALPFHCDMVLRLRRLFHYAEEVLTRPLEKAEQSE